ncbi:MAG: oligosaccharide flippase family protein [Ignavibacteriaceae bacterium]|nr:oligosaccharide flippase family protein [Ignavibacteriaceae bacterium]HRN27608.1 oligosaccharide flippase family protein [Ignavibacteriaceae bacterium]HRQ55009.1 oligosaccharide flippase family protein [Ignavibacteriaceae bacterium]
MLKKNIIANFFGTIWTALMSLAFIPYYIKLMGVESYGLIGFMASIQAVAILLDLGLAQSLNRELAKLSVKPNSGNSIANTVRTLEIIYWVIALFTFFIIFIFANVLGNNWLNSEHLSKTDLIQAIWIIGAVIAVRLPIALYTGGFNGLQLQVKLNFIISLFATLQGAGAIAVLIMIKPTIHIFLLWQLLVSFIQLIAMRYTLLNSFPPNVGGRFNKNIIISIWRFTAGLTGITLTSILLMQTDKIILSKILSLTHFAYYTFATTVAAIISRLTSPIFSAYFPKLTTLIAAKDEPDLIYNYHTGCQLVAIIIFPISLSLVFYSQQLLLFWTHDSALVSQTWRLVVILVIGSTLNGLMTLPYLLQIAHGWTKLTFYINMLLVAIAIPSIIYTTGIWGAIGAAWVWVGINVFYIFFSLHLMHRRLLIKEKWNWYFNDVGKIFLSAFIVLGLSTQIINPEWNGIQKLVFISISGIIAIISAGYSATYIRPYFRKIYRWKIN